VPADQVYLLLLNLTFYISIYIIVVLSLNLEAGYMGLPNFGKMMGVITGAIVAAYCTGRLAVRLHNAISPSDPILYRDYIGENVAIVSRLNEWLASSPAISVMLLLCILALSAGAGAAIGYLASYPAIRLREDYLGMTLLTIAEALRVISYNYRPIGGGTLGVQLPDLFGWAGPHRFSVAVITAAIVSAAVFFAYNSMLNTPFGRLLKALRDDEEAASSLGKDVVAYRKRVIVLGTSTAALAGALYSLYTAGFIATAYDRFSWTFWPWVMMMLGGPGNNFGVLIGVFAFVTARVLIFTYKTALEGVVPFNVVWLDYLLLSVSIIAILMLRPRGILPEKPVRTLKDAGERPR